MTTPSNEELDELQSWAEGFDPTDPIEITAGNALELIAAARKSIEQEGWKPEQDVLTDIWRHFIEIDAVQWAGAASIVFTYARDRGIKIPSTPQQDRKEEDAPKIADTPDSPSKPVVLESVLPCTPIDRARDLLDNAPTHHGGKNAIKSTKTSTK